MEEWKKYIRIQERDHTEERLNMNCIGTLTVTMLAGKKRIIKMNGKSFYKEFYKDSLSLMKEIRREVPDIGKSLFRFNYEFGVCYVVWFKVLTKLSFSHERTIQEIWNLTNDFLHIFPRFFMKVYAQFFIKSWRNGAKRITENPMKYSANKFDYKIQFNNINGNTFEIIFIECAMKKLFQQFDAIALMPGVCRIDYLMFNYMSIGFERTKTLGDGDDCCNCKYSLKGSCEWSPEKGFIKRK